MDNKLLDQIPTPCKQDNCYAYATHKGYCKKHQKPQWQSKRSERLPKDWSSRRATVLRRDKYICYICGGKGADSVDHVIPGDNHEYDNLKACHQNVRPYCHRKKTSREANLRQGKKVEEERTALKNATYIDWGME